MTKNFTLKCLQNAPLLRAVLFAGFALLAFNGCAKSQIPSANQSASPLNLAPNNALLDEAYPHNALSTADTSNTNLEYANADLLHANSLEFKLQNAINTLLSAEAYHAPDPPSQSKIAPLLPLSALIS